MYLQGKEPTFHKSKNSSNPYRILILILLVAFFFTVITRIIKGEVEPLFMPTPTPTRSANSYMIEGETHFTAGDLDAAIEAFEKAAELNPEDPELFTELARIQTYSSGLLTTDAERIERLSEALDSIDRAKELAPTSSEVLAVRAFVLDWNSNTLLVDEETSEDLLNEAEAEVVLALQYDNTNALALAYYAEILVDQIKWDQAEQYIQQAVENAPDSMDVHRIQAYTYETLGEYNLAIQEYEAAIEIMPNYTYLHIAVGKVYRYLELYDQALEYFAAAANLNEQLGIKDPTPYLAIANTYVQEGEFYMASLNVQEALSYTPSNPDVYAQLGIIYHKSRNYEGAIPAFECGLEGCDAEQSCEVRQCDSETDPMVAIEGLPLSGGTYVYYFTYGSVLSGLHEEGDDYCDRAMEIFAMLREDYSDDETTMSIVEEGEAICLDTEEEDEEAGETTPEE